MKMTEEQKRIVREAPAVHRRVIYEFYANEYAPISQTPKRYCLVVTRSGWTRASYQSIILLRDADTCGEGYDTEIGIALPDHGPKFWVPCNRVTYCLRSKIGEPLFKLSKNTMQRINKKMRECLGLSNVTTEELPEPGETDYKALYEELLDAVAKGVTAK